MRSAVGPGVSIQNSRKNGNSSLSRCAGADGEPARRKAVALPAAEKAEIARAEEGDDLVPDVGRVEREAQAEAGEAQVDRQVGLDLGPPIVEQVRRIGNGRRDAVAEHVDDDGTLVEVAEVKELEAEIVVLPVEQRFV